MNSYLLDRALGSISPSSFHVAQTSRLVHLLEPSPGIRFSLDGPVDEPADEVVAHQAGVNVLAIDHGERR